MGGQRVVEPSRERQIGLAGKAREDLDIVFGIVCEYRVGDGPERVFFGKCADKALVCLLDVFALCVGQVFDRLG